MNGLGKLPDRLQRDGLRRPGLEHGPPNYVRRRHPQPPLERVGALDPRQGNGRTGLGVSDDLIREVAAGVPGLDAGNLLDRRWDKITEKMDRAAANAEAVGIDSIPSFQLGGTVGGLEREELIDSLASRRGSPWGNRGGTQPMSERTLLLASIGLAVMGAAITPAGRTRAGQAARWGRCATRGRRDGAELRLRRPPSASLTPRSAARTRPGTALPAGRPRWLGEACPRDLRALRGRLQCLPALGAGRGGRRGLSVVPGKRRGHDRDRSVRPAASPPSCRRTRQHQLPRFAPCSIRSGVPAIGGRTSRRRRSARSSVAKSRSARESGDLASPGPA